ncbi:MAG: ribose 5-phosphate isomerase B [Desulfobacterales bacterium]|nr:ribose 5-phosphate isomerase B [Desulfobacterales bacterium]
MSETNKPIIIGCDHAAYQLKNTVKAYLENRGVEVKDVGAFDETSVDYPDYAAKVAGSVAKGEFERGILICGTGLGMSMAANRYSKVRAALCSDIFTAKMSRQHNNANVLVMGGRMIGDILALEIVKTWLETPFEGGRHQNRIDKFDNLSCCPK